MTRNGHRAGDGVGAGGEPGPAEHEQQTSIGYNCLD